MVSGFGLNSPPIAESAAALAGLLSKNIISNTVTTSLIRHIPKVDQMFRSSLKSPRLVGHGEAHTPIDVRCPPRYGMAARSSGPVHGALNTPASSSFSSQSMRACVCREVSVSNVARLARFPKIEKSWQLIA